MSTIKTGTTLTTAYQVEGDTTGALVIQTGATPTTAVTIDASQNVGIGTDTPAYKLDVVSATDGTLGEFKSTSTANNTALRFGLSGNDAYVSAAGDDTNLTLLTDGTEKVRLTNAGNVGIGTSSPTALGAGRTSVNINGSTDSVLWLGSNGTYTGYVQGASAACNLVGNGVDLQLSATGAKTISFSTNGAERANIDSSGNFKMNSGYGSVATAYGCRAWVNFNGTGTVAIRASGNVSSITDNGTGDYTVNFSSAMPDANYATVGIAQSNDGNDGRGNLEPNPTSAQSTSGTRVRTNAIQNVSASRDSPMVLVSVFR